VSICEEKDVTLYQNQISITMEPSIYSFSLYTALPLMLFFGFYFLFVATAFGKLFGTFLLWYPIQKCGFCHIDEHVHILPVLFSVQFGIDNVA